MEGGGKKPSAGGKKSNDKAPRFADHLTSMVVKDGDAVKLTCNIIGKITNAH